MKGLSRSSWICSCTSGAARFQCCWLITELLSSRTGSYDNGPLATRAFDLLVKYWTQREVFLASLPRLQLLNAEQMKIKSAVCHFPTAPREALPSESPRPASAGGRRPQGAPQRLPELRRISKQCRSKYGLPFLFCGCHTACVFILQTCPAVDESSSIISPKGTFRESSQNVAVSPGSKGLDYRCVWHYRPKRSAAALRRPYITSQFVQAA